MYPEIVGLGAFIRTAMSNVDYSANTYIAVTLSPSSIFQQDPASLSMVHPALTHIGQVGALQDVQLLSVPNGDWNSVKDDVLGRLGGQSGVVRVDVQQQKTRAKRDEL